MMSTDPLGLAGLDPEALANDVKNRKGKGLEGEVAKQRAATNAAKEERLQQGKSARAPAAPVVEAPPEPVKDKSELLDKLGRYKERFPETKSRNKVSAKSSAEEIEDEIHYVEQQLGARDSHMGTQVLGLAMAGLEEVTRNYCNPLGLNLNGLAQVTRDNADQFEPIIDELMIKYGANMYVAPEMRLAMALGTMVWTVHAANSGDARTMMAMEKMKQAAPVPKTDL